MDLDKLRTKKALQMVKKTPERRSQEVELAEVSGASPSPDLKYNSKSLPGVMQDKCLMTPRLLTNQRGSHCVLWHLVRHVDPENRVAHQHAGFEHNPGTAGKGDVEAPQVHKHEEDAGDQEVHHIDQWAPTNHHLDRDKKSVEKRV